MRKLGWQRPLVSVRAEFYKLTNPLSMTLPSKFVIPCQQLPAYDTGDEPLSSQIAVMSAIDIVANRQRQGEQFRPSPYFTRRQMYHTDRAYGGETSVSLSDVIRHTLEYGIVNEYECPYESGAELSPVNDDDALIALERRNFLWEKVSASVQVFRHVLSDGLPIVLGIAVSDAVDDWAAGESAEIKFPGTLEPPATGMAIVLVGWDDDRQAFVCRTPFGALWGTNGYGYIPYQYVISSGYADEFYCLVTVPNL